MQWPTTPNALLEVSAEDLKDWSRDEITAAYREDLAWAIGKIMGMQEALYLLKELRRTNDVWK